MFDRTKWFQNPDGFSGIGSDIKWCGRWSGGKRCLFCDRHAKFEEWSKEWHWYYLIKWGWRYYRTRAHYSVPQLHSTLRHSHLIGTRWFFIYNEIHKERPLRHKTTGLKEEDIKALLRNGCKLKRKCRCMSVAQRGAWHCPECYKKLTLMANHYRVDFHDMTLAERQDVKKDILILTLSGTL